MSIKNDSSYNIDLKHELQWKTKIEIYKSDAEYSNIDNKIKID